eukprot:CAMPEP_0171945376 /NCGR_PEP_ID=MMETSP0993-20121228/48130_1 /TAXON_ID=483369 /ORGANISM="non described non described, Strain CCMP2098" /LENGTH=86 /DNA_ID=CAMNT_0012588443 /DNA_START=58 /DNA_END=314 /DNA_ORIENTATION=-
MPLSSSSSSSSSSPSSSSSAAAAPSVAPSLGCCLDVNGPFSSLPVPSSSTEAHMRRGAFSSSGTASLHTELNWHVATGSSSTLARP